MLIDPELICRDCRIVDKTGIISDLKVCFYSPVKNPNGTDYLARANIACVHFNKTVYATGEDAAQAFSPLQGLW